MYICEHFGNGVTSVTCTSGGYEGKRGKQLGETTRRMREIGVSSRLDRSQLYLLKRKEFRTIYTLQKQTEENTSYVSISVSVQHIQSSGNE